MMSAPGMSTSTTLRTFDEINKALFDEGGDYGAEIGTLKTKKRAILKTENRLIFSIYGQTCGQAQLTAKQKAL